VVSTLIPQDVDKTLNVVEFYYPEDIALFEREFIDAEQAAYMETAIEDDEIGASERRVQVSGGHEGGEHGRILCRRQRRPHCDVTGATDYKWAMCASISRR
jgi:hypothetical protein